MNIIKSDYILTIDGEFRIVKNGAVAYEKKIIEVSNSFQELKQKYPQAEITECEKNSVLMPGFVNAHIHLEFSKNRTTLEYGDFLPWLYSVIEKREELIDGCSSECYEETIEEMLEFGITSFGAISSYGFDMNSCAKAKQKVVFFNEVIGSNPAAIDGFFTDFKSRVNSSEELKSETFFPAVAIHSAYSVHPVLVHHALKIARENGYRVSTHFMESNAEREWLDKSQGEFKQFFKDFLKIEKASSDSISFLRLFESLEPIFVHGVYANEEEFAIIEKQKAHIAHCPVSNRLLGSGPLNLENIKSKEIPFLIATDGLSSNFSTNMFKEMRAALMQQSCLDLHLLSRDLLIAATKNPAKALGLNCGSIEGGKDADFAVFKLPNSVENKKNLPLQLILHSNRADSVYILGEKIF